MKVVEVVDERSQNSFLRRRTNDLDPDGVELCLS
jgi:hypothetical protein